MSFSSSLFVFFAGPSICQVWTNNWQTCKDHPSSTLDKSLETKVFLWFPFVKRSFTSFSFQVCFEEEAIIREFSMNLFYVCLSDVFCKKLLITCWLIKIKQAARNPWSSKQQLNPVLWGRSFSRDCMSNEYIDTGGQLPLHMWNFVHCSNTA